MHICFVVEGYPTPEDPFEPFVKNTIAEMARQGVRCTVIAPQSVTRALMHKFPIRPTKWTDKVDETHSVRLYQPHYVSFSGKADKLNRKLFLKAAQRVYDGILTENNIDALYAHFWHMGVAASQIDNKKPLFVACGESVIAVQNRYSVQEIEQMLEQLKGTFYVSSKSYAESLELGLQRADKPYLIVPNGYDSKLFHKMDKSECRRELGWPDDARIVSFVGAFDERKGSKRLSAALSKLNKSVNVYSCFIGSGSNVPDCPNCLFAGKADHAEIKKYLNASDVFALPTRNEGCCNAIIEAMACGLPIISSDGRFNDDILSEKNSIRIAPDNVEAMEQALRELLSDEKRCGDMAAASLAAAKDLTIEKRVAKMVNFIENYLT